MDFWVRTLMEHGDSRAMICLGDECASAGLDAEAEGWYRKAAGIGDAVGMSRLADAHRRAGDRSAAAEWLEKAAEGGAADACFAWAVHLEETAGLEAAMDWYRRAAELGEARAERRLSELDGGAADDGPVARDAGSVDVASIVQTVIIGAGVLQFVKTWSDLLAKDSHAAAKRWLKDLMHRHETGGKGPAGGRNVLIVVEDPDAQPDLSLNLWLDAPPEALAALSPELVRELARPRREQRWRRGRKRPRRVFWSQERRRWEAFEDD